MAAAPPAAGTQPQGAQPGLVEAAETYSGCWMQLFSRMFGLVQAIDTSAA